MLARCRPEDGFSSDGMLARCKNGYASDTPQCAPAPNPVCGKVALGSGGPPMLTILQRALAGDWLFLLGGG